MALIYCLTSRIDGRKYVGSSKTYTTRSEIINSLRGGDRSPIVRALRIQGSSAFDFQELEWCADDEVPDKKLSWITILQPELNVQRRWRKYGS